jgi:hypothetical protein
MFHGDGYTVMQDFGSYLNHYVPYVDVELDGPSGSADAFYANWWGGTEAYAGTTLDALEPGTYTVTATHGTYITYYDVWEMAQTMWGSFFEHWLMSSPGFYSEEMNIPGPVDEFETYNQYVVVRIPYAAVVDHTTVEGYANCEGICTGCSGWSRWVIMQLVDQTGAPFKRAGLNMADAIYPATPNQLGMQTRTGSYATDYRGQWLDQYFVCSTGCPGSGETDALQFWTRDGVALWHVNGVVYKCTSITVDGQ